MAQEDVSVSEDSLDRCTSPATVGHGKARQRPRFGVPWITLIAGAGLVITTLGLEGCAVRPTGSGAQPQPRNARVPAARPTATGKGSSAPQSQARPPAPTGETANGARFRPQWSRLFPDGLREEDLDAPLQPPERQLTLQIKEHGRAAQSQPVLDCSYASPGKPQVNVRLWWKSSPGHVDYTSSEAMSDNGGLDVAAEHCPESLRAAIALGGQMSNLIAYMDETRRNQDRQQLLRQYNGGGSPAYALDAARRTKLLEPALLDKGRQPATLQAVQAFALSLEARASTVAGKDFTTGLRQSLPNITAVSAAALADFPDPAVSQRSAYEAWERRYANPLARAVATMLSIAQVRKNASLGMRPDGPNSSQYGFESGHLTDLAVVLQRMASLQLAWMDGKPATDTDYMKRITGSARAQGSDQAAERRRESDKHQQASTGAEPAGTRTVVFYGTPGQVAAAMLMAQAGDALKQSLQLLGAMNQAINQRIQVEQETASAAARFWSCYEQRCDQGKPLLATYYARLAARDYFAIKHKRGISGAQWAAIGSFTSGFHEPAAAAMAACPWEYAQAVNDYHATSGYGVADDATRLQRMLRSPQVQPWLNCRDRIELLLRPAAGSPRPH